MQTDIDFVLRSVEERKIRFIRFWFTDVLGTLKSFAVTPTDLEVAFDEGMGFDGSAIDGFARTEESDMLAHPLPETFQILPWRPSDDGVARVFCSIKTPDGVPFSGDSRECLRRQVDKAAEKGFVMNVGPELEYFYFKDDKTPEFLDHGGYFDLTPLDNASNLRRETVIMLERIGIPVEYSHHETAPSQHEIDLRFTDALSMADAVMTYRLVVKQIAMDNGVYATFMPKPRNDVAGSGMHVHQSLFSLEGENLFYDANDVHYLSDIAKSYLAGLLKYAPEFCLITNPVVNSYKRLCSGYEAPLQVTWGGRNRSSLVRIPMYKPGKEESTRLELRNPDPSCNPYLAFAVMLAAGMKGIEDNLELPAEYDGNAYEVSREAHEAADYEQLPTDLGKAIEKFKSSQLMREVLGDHIFEYIIKEKAGEWDSYLSQVSQWEFDRYYALL